MKKKQSSSKNIVILYHNGCHDGFGGAWVAWRKFKNKADYIGVEHGEDALPAISEKDVYLIDICYSEDVMRSLLARNKKVVVLDHHVSQRNVVGISTEHIYDTARCGSVIAWNYFFPDEPIPKLLRHIQDVDLWQFKVRHTKELMAALDEYPFDFELWNSIADEWEDVHAVKKYIAAGSIVLAYENRVLERMVRHAERVDFNGHAAYAVNSPILESEIGNWIVRHKKTIAIIWSYKGKEVRVSLRSDGRTDVSELALRYGGGGHKAAAGFAFDVQLEFPWKRQNGGANSG